MHAAQHVLPTEPTISSHIQSQIILQKYLQPLRDGQLFMWHHLEHQNGNVNLESHPLFIWLGSDTPSVLSPHNSTSPIPGTLYFSYTSANKEATPSGCLPLSWITHMAVGKEITPTFHHVGAALIPLDRCFSLVSCMPFVTAHKLSSNSLDLEAPNNKVRMTWAGRLHNIMRRHGHTARKLNSSDITVPRDKISVNKGVIAQPEPSTSSKSHSSVHSSAHKFSVLASGQYFTLSAYHWDFGKQMFNEQRRDVAFVFFSSSQERDLPGTLNYVLEGCAPTPQTDPVKVFNLCRIKQMYTGESMSETSSLHSVVTDDRASSSRSLVLVSQNTIWNLEASNQAIRDVWMKGLHAVLKQHDMNVDNQELKSGSLQQIQHSPNSQLQLSPAGSNCIVSIITPTIIPNDVHRKANSVAPTSVSLSPRSVALKSDASHHPISFGDPEDLFLLENKIGEGTYGEVYQV